MPRLRAPRSSRNACACIRLQNGDEESSGEAERGRPCKNKWGSGEEWKARMKRAAKRGRKREGNTVVRGKKRGREEVKKDPREDFRRGERYCVVPLYIIEKRSITN